MAITPPSTRAIRAWRALNRNPNNEWVEWAVGLLDAGVDTPHVRIVAGLSAPFNPFEVFPIVDRALEEVREPPQGEDVIEDYARALVSQLTRDNGSHLSTLRELQSICIDADYPKKYMNFYLLYHALDDLQTSSFQAYWTGLDRSNIHDTIRRVAQEWLDERSAE